MKSIKEMLAELTGLKQRVDAAGQAEIARIEGVVNETVANLQSDLSASATSVTDLTAKNGELETNLAKLTEDSAKAATDLKADCESKISAANTEKETAINASAKVAGEVRAFLSKIPGHDDYKDGGAKANATLPELFAATQSAVNTALASQGVKLENLPAQGAAPSPVAPKLSRKEFEALSPKAQTKFFKDGGKLLPND